MMHRVRRAVQVLLRLEDPPHRTALAFAVGVWLAFFPILGTHTALALLIAFAFRLNRVTLLLGTYVNNPWTLVPLYMAGTFLGCLLLGMPLDAPWALQWPRHGWDLHEMFVRVRPIVMPFLVGNLALGTLCGFVTYGVVRRMLERRGERKRVSIPGTD